MDALIIVDVQNDFLPGGALGVPDGDQILPVIDRLVPHFPRVVATRDWHPANHGSFASQHGRKVGEVVTLGGVDQVLWPDHCIQETWGAEFPPEFDLTKVEKIFSKGTDRDIDSYSAFYDNGWQKGTGLHPYLNSHDVDTIVVVGLTTEYCALATALDGVKLGYQVWVIREAIRPVNPKDEERALKVMQAAGVQVLSYRDVAW